jgi:hypothetical protein
MAPVSAVRARKVTVARIASRCKALRCSRSVQLAAVVRRTARISRETVGTMAGALL